MLIIDASDMMITVQHVVTQFEQRVADCDDTVAELRRVCFEGIAALRSLQFKRMSFPPLPETETPSEPAA